MIEYDILEKFLKGYSIDTIAKDIQKQEFDYRLRRSKHSYNETKRMVEEIIMNEYKKGRK